MDAVKRDRAWFAFVAGGLGDASASIFSHPMDVTKVRLQLQGELSSQRGPSGLGHVVNTTKNIFLQGGVANGIYAGFSAAFLRQCTFSSLRHGCFGLLNSFYLDTFSRRMTLLEQVLGGAIIGSTCAAITNPCDVVLVRMQADGHWPVNLQRQYRNVFDGLHQIITHEGVRVLWRGVSATVTRGFLITSSQLPAYHSTKAYLLQSGVFTDTVPTHVLCSIVSAATASIISCPADVIKTRMMNMQNGDNALTYSSAWDCALKISKTEGAGGFYKGLGATFARLGPHTVLMWLFQEQYMSMLRGQYFHS